MRRRDLYYSSSIKYYYHDNIINYNAHAIPNYYFLKIYIICMIGTK